jgi:Ca-activated chloride channel family protein
MFSFAGYLKREVTAGSRRIIDVQMDAVATRLSEEAVSDQVKIQPGRRNKAYGVAEAAETEYSPAYSVGYVTDHPVEFNTESYNTIHENIFHTPEKSPLSTFSIDVDAASYSNLRRFLTSGMTPPKDAIRIEEMINYFDYDYPQPKGEMPFSITTEVSAAPWNTEHQLVHVGLQGREIPTDDLPPSNLVFLVDVSGSMQSQNKLPLLKKAFNLLIDQLRPQDRVAIAVYAGAAGLVLQSTPGSEKAAIRDAINNLHAGGSTAGGAGIKLAYKVAQENFIEEGNNRIILATDGDFNVGA